MKIEHTCPKRLYYAPNSGVTDKCINCRSPLAESDIILIEEFIKYIKENICSNGDDYSFRITRKGKYAVKVGHDLSGGWDYESKEYIFGQNYDSNVF